MVPLVLSGAKTQTRRVIKNQPPAGFDRYCSYSPGVWGWTDQPSPTAHWHLMKTPHGVAGDRLWMREAWRVSKKHDALPPRDLKPRTMTVFFEAGGSIANQADGVWREDPTYPETRPDWVGRYRPPMFMMRWMSRCTLEVISIKVERLLDISEEDAIAEGISEGAANALMLYVQTPRPAATLYFELWDRINGEGSSALNPWVFATTFRKLTEAA
jgi:hypothetical protein